MIAHQYKYKLMYDIQHFNCLAIYNLYVFNPLLLKSTSITDKFKLCTIYTK